MSLLNALTGIIEKVPTPLVAPLVSLVTTVVKSIVAGDSAQETFDKASAELLSLKNAQAAEEVRLQKAVPRYRP